MIDKNTKGGHYDVEASIGIPSDLSIEEFVVDFVAFLRARGCSWGGGFAKIEQLMPNEDKAVSFLLFEDGTLADKNTKFKKK